MFSYRKGNRFRKKFISLLNVLHMVDINKIAMTLPKATSYSIYKSTTSRDLPEDLRHEIVGRGFPVAWQLMTATAL